jgi:uncharacterized protein
VKRTKYSLLAVDGGGIRGIIPARVLQEIENHFRRPTSELFDLVAGTSTGGIIALGLTKPSLEESTRRSSRRSIYASCTGSTAQTSSRSRLGAGSTRSAASQG